MSTLLLKLGLTPLLVILASVAARRWGAVVGGWLVGLPLTSAPVTVVLTAEHGPGFAATAALGILGGVATQAVFAVAYAAMARTRGPAASFGVATVAFAACTAALTRAPLPLAGMALLAAGALVAGLSAFRALGVRRAVSGDAVEPVPPRWDLPVRAVAATAVVVVVTALADVAGARLAGLITPFPVYAAVLTMFAHQQSGGEAASTTLRGLLLGLFGFAAFFVALAATLPRIGWAAFAPAAAATLALEALTYRGLRAATPLTGEAPLATVSSRP